MRNFNLIVALLLCGLLWREAGRGGLSHLRRAERTARLVKDALDGLRFRVLYRKLCVRAYRGRAWWLNRTADLLEASLKAGCFGKPFLCFCAKSLDFLYCIFFTHRPPPVVGPPSNVNASDRHGRCQERSAIISSANGLVTNPHPDNIWACQPTAVKNRNVPRGDNADGGGTRLFGGQ